MIRCGLLLANIAISIGDIVIDMVCIKIQYGFMNYTGFFRVLRVFTIFLEA